LSPILRDNTSSKFTYSSKLRRMKSYSESSSPLTLNSFADYERNVQTSSVHRGRPFESVCELSTDSVAQQVKSIGDQENDKENEPVVDGSNQEQQHPGTSTPVKKASSNEFVT
uniref:Microtubule-associated tumor suppressor candidate 2 n=1 Tax=Anisakis simplex TaxID=6269 RepID=A0A0M3JKF8_ANISI